MCCHRYLPAALKHTLDATEKRYRDCGDRRDGQSLRQAAWPREDPDYVAPAPRTEALKRTLDAPEKRYRDCGDRRGGQSLRRATWPHEEPDSVAPAPRMEVELKRGQNPRAG
ncbi:hypothetical protein NDU88_000808 [Pleurodeles waltl]|uniref:Uncharacterized protein n=1 Tax=Pleurodeles waltl TaxID=8319 RepID=A0AAV7UV46_PLEWA|nr:hypothetical protein NDU88_000808 [Pleurodeles waltl]